MEQKMKSHHTFCHGDQASSNSFNQQLKNDFLSKNTVNTRLNIFGKPIGSSTGLQQKMILSEDKLKWSIPMTGNYVSNNLDRLHHNESNRLVFKFPNNNPNISQKQQSQIFQLRKDCNLQKQMIEQMLKRIKQLQTKSSKQQQQKLQILKKNQLLQYSLKDFQTKNKHLEQQLRIQQQQNIQIKNSISKKINLEQEQASFKPDKPNPIFFDVSRKDELFPQGLLPSIFNEDDTHQNVFTQKSFTTVDGYLFQAYVAFNAFYQIKYVILQKIKNNFGFLDLTKSSTDVLRKQPKDNKSVRWYLYHQNSNRNVFPQIIIDQLAFLVTQKMKSNESTPISVNIEFGKYLSFKQSKCVVYHPDWTLESSFSLELFNFFNYNQVNELKKLIINRSIASWIEQESKKQTTKKLSHELLMWFDDSKGVFHMIWN